MVVKGLQWCWGSDAAIEWKLYTTLYYGDSFSVQLDTLWILKARNVLLLWLPCHMVHMRSQSSSGTPKVSFPCPENASSKLEISMVITGIPGVFRLTWRDNSFFVICFMTSSSYGFKTMSLASWAEGEILTTPLKNALWQSSHKSTMEWMWICSAPCCETAHKVPCMKVHIDFLPGCEERADLFLTTAVSICKRST